MIAEFSVNTEISKASRVNSPIPSIADLRALDARGVGSLVQGIAANAGVPAKEIFMTGNPVYAGNVTIGGKNYTISPTAFSPANGDQENWLYAFGLNGRLDSAIVQSAGLFVLVALA